MNKFKCPECDLVVEALASEAWHTCPKRMNQPVSQKGYRRKPETVDMVLQTPRSGESASARLNQVAKNEARRTKRAGAAGATQKAAQRFTFNAEGHLVVGGK